MGVDLRGFGSVLGGDRRASRIDRFLHAHRSSTGTSASSTLVVLVLVYFSTSSTWY